MTAIVNETVSVKKKPSGRRVIFASAFGNALEFFDFGVYNFFVVYISTLFFPPSADKNVALLLAFATFGVSFFMRPLGGIIVGAWADRFGRKPAMVFTIALMSLGTLMIGIAPTSSMATSVCGIMVSTARLLAMTSCTNSRPSHCDRSRPPEPVMAQVICASGNSPAAPTKRSRAQARTSVWWRWYLA